MTKQNKFLPVFLATDKNKILLVGAGNVAMAKLSLIAEFSDNITIVAKKINHSVRELAKLRSFELIEANFDKSQLKDKKIVIAATNKEEVNQEIAKQAKQLGVLVNAVDNPKISNFIFGSVVKRGDVTMAISSNGISPVLTRYIKQKIENMFPARFSELTNFIAKYKEKVKKILTSFQARRIFWQEIFEGKVIEEIYVGNNDKAEKLLLNLLAAKQNKARAALYLIGVGPGDPDLITLKAVRLISKADVVLYDRLVPRDILTVARREAMKINVGKTRDLHRYTQSEINKLIKEYLLQDKIVARLKGGDTTIFANLHDEINVAKNLDIPYQVVPGVTAASGAAAYLGIPLTKRGKVCGVRFLTYYKNNLLNSNYWQDLASSKDSLVFYMSSHRIAEIISQLSLYGMPKNTPIVAVEQATTICQKQYTATLEDFIAKYRGHKFKSPTIVIIGEVVAEVKNSLWLEESKVDAEYFQQLQFRDEHSYVEV